MATKQISATIDQKLSEWVSAESKCERRTFSQMVEILLEEAKKSRQRKIKSK